ncbi:cytochrome P450 family protein [Amycolatopsis cihanbeyliensis]|uniref:Cytochrome P450 n=1 Tax=Amycolatopsis cihanbeyliensis TaxID=1128664 RepID=A0A542DFH3_AMYCI|nr:cytochrome P450 [Amycolatopsis cihanbeyliensis]TQJ01822.1 cytochrome P450 [Amycolatopsis cihanbeyliensis]
MPDQVSADTLPAPFDSAYFADPYAILAELRESGPVHRVATPEGDPIWLLTREADIRAALTDPRLALNRIHSRGGYAGFALPPALDANLLNRDGADHTRIRRLVSGAFTPARAEALGAGIRSTATRLARTIAERGGGDLVADYAAPLPLAAIGDLLDVPEPDRERFAQWTSTMLAPANRAQVTESVQSIHRFLLELIAARRANPGEDLLSTWIGARDQASPDNAAADNTTFDATLDATLDDEHRLDENELVSLTFLVLWAGIENITHLISHGMLLLLRRPDQLAALRADPALLPAMVEELLRYAHPNVLSIRRFTTAEVEIGGVRIPAGDTVMLALASANRDPARFPDPGHLDPARADNPHLAFGHGPHYCLGAALARLELRIAFGVLLEQVPAMELAIPEHELRWRPSFRSLGLLSLPVRGGCDGQR